MDGSTQIMRTKAFYCHATEGIDGENMETLKQAAQAFVPPQKTKNISELKRVSVEIELKTKEGKDREGQPYTYKYIEVEGQEYRVAGPVIRGIKNLIEKFPNMKYFSVMKDGDGMNTKYQVVPLLEQAA